MLIVLKSNTIQQKKSLTLIKVSDFFKIIAWRRPTLPQGCPSSTIGLAELNYSVRNGKRCTPAGMTAEIVEGRRMGAPSKLHSDLGVF